MQRTQQKVGVPARFGRDVPKGKLCRPGPLEAKHKETIFIDLTDDQSSTPNESNGYHLQTSINTDPKWNRYKQTPASRDVGPPQQYNNNWNSYAQPVSSLWSGTQQNKHPTNRNFLDIRSNEIEQEKSLFASPDSLRMKLFQSEIASGSKSAAKISTVDSFFQSFADRSNNQTTLNETKTVVNFPHVSPNESFVRPKPREEQQVQNQNINARSTAKPRSTQLQYIHNTSQQNDTKIPLNNKRCITQPVVECKKPNLSGSLFKKNEIWRKMELETPIKDTPATNNADLIRAVVDRSHPNGCISKDNWPLLECALLKVYKSIMDRNPGPPPHCRDGGWHQGNIKMMKFQDLRSLKLFTEAVKAAGEVWKGCNLEVVTLDNIASKPRVKAILPIEPSDPKDIVNLIGLSNPQISTFGWKVEQITKIDSTVIEATISVTEAAINSLAKTNGEVAYAFATIFLKSF